MVLRATHSGGASKTVCDRVSSRPRLGALLHRVVGVGLLYMLFSFIEGMLRVNAVSPKPTAADWLRETTTDNMSRREQTTCSVLYCSTYTPYAKIMVKCVCVRLTFVSL